LDGSSRCSLGRKKHRNRRGVETTNAVQTSVADARTDKTAVLGKTTANVPTTANAAVETETEVLATTPKGAIAMTEAHAKVVIVNAKVAIVDVVVALKASDARHQANSP
jgi:hypothetical protein